VVRVYQIRIELDVSPRVHRREVIGFAISGVGPHLKGEVRLDFGVDRVLNPTDDPARWKVLAGRSVIASHVKPCAYWEIYLGGNESGGVRALRPEFNLKQSWVSRFVSHVEQRGSLVGSLILT
jgi:hypothetical protein